MDVHDLKPGDILLFSPEKGSWISEAIVLLTGAPVSHAAMTYERSDDLVEATPPAVREAPAAERFRGRTISVRRLKRAPTTMEPVLEAATRYLNAHEPYAMTNLYLVGMLLLFKKLTPHGPVQKVMMKIFRRLTAEVIDYVNQREHPGELPMVCSQYVFQSFEDAGPDYELEIHDGVVLEATPGAAPADRGLLSQAAARSPDVAAVPADAPATGETQSEEDLCRELVEALRTGRGEAEPPAAAVPELRGDLVSAIHEFARAVHRAGGGEGAPGAGIGADPRAGLELLQSREAYFVTPADLLHCTNTETVGVIRI